MSDNDNPFDDLFFWMNLAFFDFSFSKKSDDKSINVINIKTNNLFVLRGLIPRHLWRLKGIKLRMQFLMRTTYPVPLGRGC